MQIQEIQSRTILTRASGYLRDVCSHSLQPYRGCALGGSLCGVGCYAQHQRFLNQGRAWGTFLEVKTNAAELYLNQYDREKAWAKRNNRAFVIFMSSATEPFPPAEKSMSVTGDLLKAMKTKPPDGLIVQTHSPLVADYVNELAELSSKCSLRVHLSIESDIDRLPGLPGPFSSVARRVEAARRLKNAGLNVVITVAPLLPMRDPDAFFKQLTEVANAVVIDHFLGGGDGAVNGSRTRRTALPAAMESVKPQSVKLDYRDSIISIASLYFPGRVGVGIDGFAGHYLMGQSIQTTNEMNQKQSMKAGLH